MDTILADSHVIALALSLGASMGLSHAFEPDHMTAVSTLVASQHTKSRLRKVWAGITRSSVTGAVWGAGHTTTLVGFGLLAYVAASAIQNWIFEWMEFAVGLMLIIMGILAILKGRFTHEHVHAHSDGTIHSHKHDHRDGGHAHIHRSYIIGLVHGLAGSGALVALTSATLADLDMVILFMLVFGAGSAAGMCALGGLLGASLGMASERIRKMVRYAAGTLSILLGIIIVYQITALTF